VEEALPAGSRKAGEAQETDDCRAGGPRSGVETSASEGQVGLRGGRREEREEDGGCEAVAQLEEALLGGLAGKVK
jgi:hypothetical protein